ncbi:MAG: hypothetical protein IPO06_02420 [Leptospiraceae bacterium]|nr:hypothetical protein [Leptospiraceae bacterium]MBK9498232.1 hypothetical protein [Leptospiraceae bacterium]
MKKETNLSYIRLSLILGIIVLLLLNCTGNEEEIEEVEDRPDSSDVASRAISPQKEYTKDNPAEWESVVNDHLPEIIFNKSKSKENITVKVLGKKFSERHYIEVIGIMDEQSADLDVKYIDRGSQPTAILSLNPRDHDPEKIKVFAKCNLHDLWTVPLVAKEEY